MKTTLNLLLPISLLIAASSFASAAATITDDFNDGNDTGWTRLSPLTVLGAPANFNFPGGGYQIIANPQTVGPQYGPARAGSLRLDETYSQFSQTVDIIDWDSTKTSMVMGMFARATQPGLGTTDGYSLTVTTATGALDIYRILDESPNTLVATGGAGLLVVGQDYRLVFSGVGTLLSGQIYNLANLVTPLASISGNDAAYATGSSGLLVFSNSASEIGNATFDNYVSAVPEPSTFSVFGLCLGLLIIRRSRLA